ncbi:hypothetical protein LZ32DRAFT_673142, partial [Colletotrichum eremochloae]
PLPLSLLDSSRTESLPLSAGNQQSSRTPPPPSLGERPQRRGSDHPGTEPCPGTRFTPRERERPGFMTRERPSFLLEMTGLFRTRYALIGNWQPAPLRLSLFH